MYEFLSKISGLALTFSFNIKLKILSRDAHMSTLFDYKPTTEQFQLVQK